MTGAPGVDVSSGVETTPGIKDPSKIKAFIDATRGFHLHGSPHNKEDKVS
jgi:phosphoribosylanthranilate isomerase